MVAFETKYRVVEWFESGKAMTSYESPIRTKAKAILSENAMAELQIPLYRISGERQLVYSEKGRGRHHRWSLELRFSAGQTSI